MTEYEKQIIVNKKAISPSYENAGYKIVEFALNDEGDNAYALVKVRSKKIVSYSISGTNERKHFSRLAKGIGIKKTTETLLRKKVNSILENILKEEMPQAVTLKLKSSLEDSLLYLGYYNPEKNKDAMILQKSIEDFMNKNGM